MSFRRVSAKSKANFLLVYLKLILMKNVFLSNFIFAVYVFNLLVIFAEADRRANLDDFIPTKSDETLKKIGKTLEQCLKRSTGPTIFFGANITDRPGISKSLLSSDQISAIKMNETNIPQRYERLRIYHFDEIMFARKSCFAGNFVLSASSNSSLAFALRELKGSIWWNSEALFLVTNDGNVGNSCRFASAFLDTLWNFDVMSAIYLCVNSNGRWSVYSFNPFADLATSFWKVVPAKDPSLHYKVLLEHIFEESDINADYSSVCNELYFDKTTNLNGFHVRAAVSGIRTKLSSYHATGRKVGFDRFEGYLGEIYAIVGKQMNLTATVKLAGDLRTVDEDKNPVANLKELVDGSLDIEIVGRYPTLHWRGSSMAFAASGMRFLSLKKSKSFVRRFLSIFTTQVLVCYTIIFISVLVALKCLFLKRSMSALALELVRLLINQPTIEQPDRFSLRLVFFYLILIFTDISIYLQSQLSAIDTVKESVVIDGVGDLLTAKSPIYGSELFKEQIIEREIYNRFHAKSIDECVDLVLNGSDVVCAIGSIAMRFYAYEGDLLHISKNAYFSTSLVYRFREDWPLLRKFNGILLRIVEGGFDSLIADRLESKFRGRNMRRINDRQADGDICELEIGLYLLSFGVSLSIFTFCLELIYCKVKLYRSKVAVYEFKKIKFTTLKKKLKK